MVEKEITCCDICKSQAKHDLKCSLCKKDLCSEHALTVGNIMRKNLTNAFILATYFRQKNIYLCNIYLCPLCEDKIVNLFENKRFLKKLEIKSFKKKIREEIEKLNTK